MTETPLFASEPNIWDEGLGVRVKTYGGDLASASSAAVLNGANLIAMGDGSGDNWEVLQFRDATLMGEDTYQLQGLLRGQVGSETQMPEFWPAGSLMVLLDGVPEQIDLASSARDLARHYRIGPALRAYTDTSYIHRIDAFKGNGLRPYAPCHLRADAEAGDIAFTWVRRTRIDGDSWSGIEVPLGESYEAYLVRVLDGGSIIREEQVGISAWTYSAAQQLGDGVSGPITVEVAQLSDRFGAGPAAHLEISV